MKGDRNRETMMRGVVDDVVALTTSPLYAFRKENGYVPVVGEGSLEAEIMLVGEAPGEKEAKTGKPFIGRSGKFLDELLDAAGLKREDIYITSIVKDRPQKNRDPKPAEIELYAPFLDRQIEIIKPKVIATLGRFSMDYVMNRYGPASDIGPISKLHGQVFETEIAEQKVKIVPLYHPAVALYNPGSKDELREDFKVLKTVIS